MEVIVIESEAFHELKAMYIEAINIVKQQAKAAGISSPSPPAIVWLTTKKGCRENRI